jgi:Tol biopolymer transport system component
MLQRAKGRVENRVRWRLRAAGVFCLVAFASSSAGAQTIELLSRTTRGASAEGRSLGIALSENGLTALFRSEAVDLVNPRLQLPRADLYLRERGLAPTTQRVAAETDDHLDGFAPAISADGRFIAFASDATDLVAGDTNGVADIFILDRDDGSITRVEGDFGEPDGTSNFPRLSADGRWVVYASQATNLVPDDTNAVTDIFLFDRDGGATRRVSVDFFGNQANGHSRSPAISADGGTVAFVSAATNLLDEELDGAEQVYVHEVQVSETFVVSVSSSGQPSTGDCFLPDLSADGSIVAFKSAGSNLVEADTNGVPDVFVHDRDDGQTTRISVDDFGNESNDLSGGPAISDDGRYVAFVSFSSTFDPQDGNGASDVFVVDRSVALGGSRIRRVSVEQLGNARPGGPAPDFPVAISGDGVWIGFASAAENLVDNDNNNRIDAFVACNPFEPEANCVPMPTPGPTACTGDCDGDGAVTINELVRMTNMALGVSICGEGAVAACPAGDANGDCAITVEELVRGVGNNQNGCTRYGDLPLQDVIDMCCPL